ncbi:MAG: helix-turn-helix transcriptional regulator [Anaerolineae bacterium]|nr:helix-turn-helix transcriptional regulator [Anaerolineae bacterium]
MNKIPELLEKKGWTKYRLAQETGMSHPQILRIVNSEKEIPPNTTWRTVKRIATVLGVTPNDLED